MEVARVYEASLRVRCIRGFFMYVWFYVRMLNLSCARVCSLNCEVFTFTHEHAYKYTFRMHKHTCVRIRTPYIKLSFSFCQQGNQHVVCMQLCACTSMYASTRMYIYIYIHTYIHTYMYAYIYTYIHTYIYIHRNMLR
jgi:hypothetical protein